MTSTPDGVILHWPDTDLDVALNDSGDSQMVCTILKESMENSFQKGQDLVSDYTSTVLLEETGSSGSPNPE